MRPVIALKRLLILVHRWSGVVFAILFVLWFVSGIFLMYWDYPEISPVDRLQHSPALDPARIKFTPAQAFDALGSDRPPDSIRINSFDGRPVYRFRWGRDEAVVYADTGEQQIEVPRAMLDRAASTWSRQPASAATVEENTEEDQWTVPQSYRVLRPMLKYSFPDGQQVYVSENTGEVAQYTTTSSRLYAWLGAIPHWLYFTPLRKNGPAWSRVVIWSSGIGTAVAILGIVVGLFMYSPKARYRFPSGASRIPYTGQKRWHTILGLLFGTFAATWAFSGMMSMEPFPVRARVAGSLPSALRGGRLNPASFGTRNPSDAIAAAGFPVKDLELSLFAGEPFYLASDGQGTSRIIPLQGPSFAAFPPERIFQVVRSAADPAELRLMTEYDTYYLDRHHARPLPVIYAELKDQAHSRYYIDPRTGRIAGSYNAGGWVNRWLYHGLHSMDLPWLYKYRPLWDIVVLTLMTGGTALCITSLVLAWRVLKRKLGLRAILA